MKRQGQQIKDQPIQSSNIKFTFIASVQKLHIEAHCQKENISYAGEIVANPYVDFDLTKEIIEVKQFKVMIKNQNLLKIKVGPVILELHAKQKREVQKLKQTIKQMQEKQDQLLQIIEELKNPQVNIVQNASNHIDFIPLGLSAEQINWSNDLKYPEISVSKKRAVIKRSTYVWQFCLLNKDFSSELKNKQCWAIRIRRLANWIKIGLCQKRLMQKYYFKDQQFKWGRPGHGCHLISSEGFSYSQIESRIRRRTKEFQIY